MRSNDYSNLTILKGYKTPFRDRVTYTVCSWSGANNVHNLHYLKISFIPKYVSLRTSTQQFTTMAHLIMAVDPFVLTNST